MKLLIPVLMFTCFNVFAGQCIPGDGQPCSINMDKALPFGRIYNLEIIEAALGANHSGNDETTGFWGAEGAYPDTYIKKLSLIIEQTSLQIPVKAYSDLGNIYAAEVKENQFGIVLIVRGGDAAGSYYATFVFDETGVRKRTVRSVAYPDQLWEKTTFLVPKN